jgi:hypothetical protein
MRWPPKLQVKVHIEPSDHLGQGAHFFFLADLTH